MDWPKRLVHPFCTATAYEDVSSVKLSRIVQKECNLNTYKTTARIVGVLFLLATATYSFGNGLVESILSAPDYLLHLYSSRAQVITGVLLKFVAAAANVAIGVLLFPILKKHSETGAVGYLATRIYDGIGLVVSGILILALVTWSQETVQAGTHSTAYTLSLGNLLVEGSNTAFVVTMLGLGLGAMPFAYLLYRSRLIPRWMALLGFVSYASLFTGSLLELLGLNLNMIHFVPGGLFEFILPLWLFTKGFNSSAIASDAASTDAKVSGTMTLTNA